jgi:hypothetical protein
MVGEQRQPPLRVELSRPVLAACRHDPELARAINGILLRAARRLGRMMEEDRSVRVAGSVEGVTLDLRLFPPDRCLVEALHTQGANGSPDLTV